jgi:hypothetical protein
MALAFGKWVENDAENEERLQNIPEPLVRDLWWGDVGKAAEVREV